MSKIYGPCSEKQKMILENDADILVIGGAAGSGKSFLLQLMPLKIIDDPHSSVVMFRRTTPQLEGEGGLWPKAVAIYSDLPENIKPKFREKDHKFIFPRFDPNTGKWDRSKKGAVVKYCHMEYVQDKLNHQGLEYTMVCFDEGTQFEWEQIDYLMSRLRSQSKYPSRMVISCNPDSEHMLAKLVRWWLDDEGYPDPEKCGKKRYFIRRDGEFIWGDSKEELIEKYTTVNGLGVEIKPRPLSFSFIGATIFDNPVCLRDNPEYLAFLEGLPELEKAQLLHGNWFAKPEGANYFQRSFLRDADRVPLGSVSCRAWDKAGTERTSGNKFPDFTTSIKVSKDSDGFYYLSGDYCPENVDDGRYSTGLEGKFCKKAGERDVIIRKQAQFDGDDCIIVFSVDPGQAGKSEFLTSSRSLLAEGFRVEEDPMPSNKSKLTRFSPFANLAQQGMVRIVKSSFHPDTLEAFLTELEKFNGERSTFNRKDDWADCVASAINFLEKEEVALPCVIPSISSPSMFKRFI